MCKVMISILLICLLITPLGVLSKLSHAAIIAPSLSQPTPADRLLGIIFANIGIVGIPGLPGFSPSPSPAALPGFSNPNIGPGLPGFGGILGGLGIAVGVSVTLPTVIELLGALFASSPEQPTQIPPSRSHTPVPGPQPIDAVRDAMEKAGKPSKAAELTNPPTRGPSSPPSSGAKTTDMGRDIPLTPEQIAQKDAVREAVDKERERIDARGRELFGERPVTVADRAAAARDLLDDRIQELTEQLGLNVPLTPEQVRQREEIREVVERERQPTQPATRITDVPVRSDPPLINSFVEPGRPTQNIPSKSPDIARARDAARQAHKDFDKAIQGNDREAAKKALEREERWTGVVKELAEKLGGYQHGKGAKNATKNLQKSTRTWNALTGKGVRGLPVSPTTSPPTSSPPGMETPSPTTLGAIVGAALGPELTDIFDIIGVAGISGIQGEPGTPGESGIPGEPGIQGEPGAGPSGPSGPSGPAGSSEPSEPSGPTGSADPTESDGFGSNNDDGQDSDTDTAGGGTASHGEVGMSGDPGSDSPGQAGGGSEGNTGGQGAEGNIGGQGGNASSPGGDQGFPGPGECCDIGISIGPDGFIGTFSPSDLRSEVPDGTMVASNPGIMDDMIGMDVDNLVDDIFNDMLDDMFDGYNDTNADVENSDTGDGPGSGGGAGIDDGGYDDGGYDDGGYDDGGYDDGGYDDGDF